MIEDGTYDKDGQKIAYPNGYQVGIWDKPVDINNLKMSFKDIKWIVEKLTRTTDEFGIWTDHAAGTYWLEPCVWIQDLDSALRVARALNQIAIWDWANMKEIRL
jgi:hypothetical protein